MNTTDRVEELLSVYLADRARPGGPSPEELCRDCPELLPELQKRIAAADFGDRLLRSTGRPSASDTTSYGSEFPDRVGEYAVRGVLGRGGMGAVLEADDAKLGRRVAVKVMLPRTAVDPVARERFLREARAAAAVHHDHVVPIFHVGEHDNVPFLVMPLLEGESLEDRLRRGPLNPDEVVRVGREAAEGLAAAHAKGVVHRDVKPANLWLEAANGRVKVLDFGLARAADGTDSLTQPGGVLGTPAYMAPEQADGKEADARADLFSLGATLYQAATGVVPFRGATLTAVLRAVAEHHPPAPAEVNPEVPRALSNLIVRLLAKNPDDRPASARAVADELAVPASRPPAALSPTAEFRSARRNRWPVRVAALVLLLGGGVAIWFATRPPTPAADPNAGAERPPDPAPRSEPKDARLPAADPLKGSVDLLVYRRGRDGREGVVRLGYELAMPLRTGDEFRIVAEVSRPAYLYLFWIDENGVGVPVYPWKLGEWGTRPANEEMKTKLDLQSPTGKAFAIGGDTRGMETIVMLARSARLEAGDDEVRGWFAGLEPLPLRPGGERDRVWFENFDVQEYDPTGTARSITSGDGPGVATPRGLQSALKQKVGPVELSRAISFARVGPNK